MQKTLESSFGTRELELTARETGFLVRRSKFTPAMFFDMLMYDVSSGNSKSLNRLAIEAGSEYGLEISKQGIDKRYGDGAIAFISRLIEKAMAAEIDNQIESDWLKKFNRVKIKDATRFDVIEQYRDILPGSGGSASKAGACIQFEYDLKQGKIIQLDITPANRPDNKEASEVLDDVQKGDLIIRDLGYHIFKSFRNIIDNDAFFISRLHPKTHVFILKKGNYQRLDFKDLYHKMKMQEIIWKSMNVFLGGEKLPVTLTIEIAPDEVYEKRVKAANKNHKKKGYQTSEDYKFMSRFHLFITNIPKKDLPTRTISILYRIRWQIELIFKIWKSIFRINHHTPMKFKRWLCLLYVRLLIMIINWNIIMNRRNQFYKCRGKLLSMNKCFKTLFDNNHRLRKALKQGSEEIKKLLLWADKIFSEKHWSEEKKMSKSFNEIISIKICKSNVYAYI
jgi:IS4 transposase